MKRKTQKKAAYCVLGIVACVVVMILVAAIAGNQSYAHAADPLLYSAETFDEDIAGVLNPELDYLILVNDDYPYDFNGYQAYVLEESLIEVPDVYSEPTRVEKATYVAFTQLQAALAKQGVIIGLYSAYRTEPDQQWVYDNYGNLEGWSDTNRVMLPGYSEHHTGLMINYFVWHQLPGDNNPWCTITPQNLATDPELQFIYQIILDNLADYGFIERYPAGGEASTRVPSEPYEIRFVGDSETAHEIMDGGYTLEEYLYPDEYLCSEEYQDPEVYSDPEAYLDPEEYQDYSDY